MYIRKLLFIDFLKCNVAYANYSANLKIELLEMIKIVQHTLLVTDYVN